MMGEAVRRYRLSACIALVLFCPSGASAQQNDLARVEALNQQTVQAFRERRYEDAIASAREALAIRENVLGSNHLEVASSLQTLAFIYDNQGRYAEAEPFYKRSLAIREKALGPNDPEMARSLSYLATLYMS